MSEQSFQGMPTLSNAENEASLTEERIKELLKPYEGALLNISDDEAKKAWLKSQDASLSEDGLNKKHDELIKYAEEQTESIGLQGDIKDLLKAYYYVHGLARYQI